MHFYEKLKRTINLTIQEESGKYIALVQSQKQDGFSTTLPGLSYFLFTFPGGCYFRADA